MVIAIGLERDAHNETNLTWCFILFQELSHKLLSKHQVKVKVRLTANGQIKNFYKSLNPFLKYLLSNIQ